MAIGIQAAKEPTPSIVPVGSVGEAPGYQGLTVELLPCGVGSHNLLEDPPVSTRLVLRDALAPLKVELVHLLANVVGDL